MQRAECDDARPGTSTSPTRSSSGTEYTALAASSTLRDKTLSRALHLWARISAAVGVLNGPVATL